MCLEIILVFLEGVVKGETELASSGLRPLLAKFRFSRLVDFCSCMIHIGSCVIHSAFAHLEPSSLHSRIPLMSGESSPNRYFSIPAIFANIGNPGNLFTLPPCPRLPPNFTRAHPIHPRIGRGSQPINRKTRRQSRVFKKSN